MDEELCKFDVNQCNVSNGTADKTCTYSELKIDMEVRVRGNLADRSELTKFGSFGPDNQFQWIKANGKIVINTPSTDKTTTISRVVDSCDGIKEIVYGTFEEKKTKYFFGGVEYCTLSGPDGGVFARKKIDQNKQHFGTAISIEKELSHFGSKGIDCEGPQRGCSLDDENLCMNFYAYQLDGACDERVEDTPTVEDPVPTEEPAPEATASTEENDLEPPTDSGVTPVFN